ncbi:MAG: hypothetical protein LBC14_03185 [Desulfovibrio sp.]|jgi:hypothetical protein|nr:hypothetical protein [Desulfovibrio sp.]
MIFDTVAKQIPKVAVILGNGPSLRGFDFAKELEGFDTFGMNAACRYWHTIGWYPTYYASLDPAQSFSLKEEIAELVRNKEYYGINAFLLRQNIVTYLNIPKGSDYVINYEFWIVKNKYHTLMQSNRMTTGALTTLWAATLGYKRLILLGMDAHFPAGHEKSLLIARDPKSLANKFSYTKQVQIEEPSAENANYFFDGYYKKGDRLFTSAEDDKKNGDQAQYESWLFIPRAMQKFGVDVINANYNSMIDIFSKCTWSEAKEKCERR